VKLKSDKGQRIDQLRSQYLFVAFFNWLWDKSSNFSRG